MVESGRQGTGGFKKDRVACGAQTGAVVGLSFALSVELLRCWDMSTVVGMGSAEKIKPRNLVVGGRYLHRNGLFIRQIEAIEGNTVHYHDQESSWSCSDSVCVRTCPTLATPADEARVARK